MDAEVSVLLHCAAWRGLLGPQVHVELSDSFNRQTDDALQRYIEEVWTERVSRETWLFNGAKFRLHSFSLASAGPPPSPAACPDLPPCRPSPRDPQSGFAGDAVAQPPRSPSREENPCDVHSPAQHTFQKENSALHQQESGDCCKQDGNLMVNPSIPPGCSMPGGGIGYHHRCPNRAVDLSEASPSLTLRLGLTCYKDFLGTNWSQRAADLRRRGEREFGDPCALLAQPLGVGGVLCTHDGQVVLIRRSQRVAEAGGLLDIPGGHPEPQAVCWAVGGDAWKDQVDMAVLQRRPRAVVSELFSSVCAEIRDEVNVPLTSLGEPVLMGIALNHTSAGRPSAEFYISCSLTSDKVREAYWRGGAEANESTDIIFLSRKEVLGLDPSSPLWSELCPSAKGAVLLYQRVLPDDEQGRST